MAHGDNSVNGYGPKSLLRSLQDFAVVSQPANASSMMSLDLHRQVSMLALITAR